jgi:8-oxo-dGTP diphosphatase
MALVARENIFVKSWSDASDAKFFPVDKLPKLAFDHKKIMEYAIKRLKRKLEYTNVSQYILPAKFTLTQLQKVYEIVLNQKIDVRNFRKKIEKLWIVKETGEKELGNQYRPARLFQFVNKDFEIVDII